MSQREDLKAEITREETRLSSLRAEIEAAEARLAELHEQLAAIPLEPVVVQTGMAPAAAKTPETNAAKLALFRSLFRGRKDVFPRRWENVKKGKSGYSPACHNEWIRGLCQKSRRTGRRANCTECPTQ